MIRKPPKSCNDTLDVCMLAHWITTSRCCRDNCKPGHFQFSLSLSELNCTYVYLLCEISLESLLNQGDTTGKTVIASTTILVTTDLLNFYL